MSAASFFPFVRSFPLLFELAFLPAAVERRPFVTGHREEEKRTECWGKTEFVCHGES